MKRVALVSCSSMKGPRRTRGKDLYTSPIFKMSRQWAEANADEWAILSAKHGLVMPGELVSPYDEELPGGKRARADWAAYTRDAILRRWPGAARGDVVFIVLAGAKYVDALEGLHFAEPLKGLGTGHRRSWLIKNTPKRNLRRRKPVTRRNTPFKPVVIGTSPSGVLWVARRPNQVAIMTERLAALKARAKAKAAPKASTTSARRVALTANQSELLDDMFSLREDGSDKAFKLRRSFISGSSSDLKDLADEVEREAHDAADRAVGDIHHDVSDAQFKFAAVSAFSGILNLAAKLRGSSISTKLARARATKALR